MNKACFQIGSLCIALTAAAVHSGSWSDSLATALCQDRREDTRRLLGSRSGETDIVSDFASLGQRLKSQPCARVSANVLHRIFESPLASGLKDASFDAYKEKIGDTTLAGDARILLWRVMAIRERNLSAAHKDSVGRLMLRTLNASRPLPELQAMVLKRVGQGNLTNGDTVFIPFLTSPDTLIRSAAYQGLGQRIVSNRRANRGSENLKIFNDVKALVSESPDLNQVQVIAQISEDYGRNYLLTKCAGSPEKIKAIFYRDADLEHSGLVLEAVKLMNGGGQSAAMAKAIQYGLKNPDSLINRLKDGNDSEKTASQKLQQIFPSVASVGEAN
jgi:hypothetical protein